MASTEDIPEPLRDRIASELEDIRPELEEIAASDTELANDVENALNWLEANGGDAGAA